MPEIFRHFLNDAAIFAGLFTLALLLPMLYSPRLLMRSYPAPIQAMVPPRTAAERRLSILLGLPFLSVLLGYPLYATYALHAGNASFFLLWAYAAGITFAGNLWDWLIIDWLVFCAITPAWLVIPGTEGHPAYKDYWIHFRGFMIGTVISAASGLVAAAIVTLAQSGRAAAR